jgi:hypothetical protein
MEPRPVPNSVIEENPTGEIITMGSPPAASPDECSDATMYMEIIEFAGDVVPYFSSYYQPTKDELELLNDGGLIRINFVGHVVPHYCRAVK